MTYTVTKFLKQTDGNGVVSIAAQVQVVDDFGNSWFKDHYFEQPELDAVQNGTFDATAFFNALFAEAQTELQNDLAKKQITTQDLTPTLKNYTPDPALASQAASAKSG